MRAGSRFENRPYGSLQERALAVLKHLNTELQRLELRNELQSKVRSDMDQQQREYFLHQQMKTIQEELGGLSYDEEIDEMRRTARVTHDAHVCGAILQAVTVARRRDRQHEQRVAFDALSVLVVRDPVAQ